MHQKLSKTQATLNRKISVVSLCLHGCKFSDLSQISDLSLNASKNYFLTCLHDFMKNSDFQTKSL